MHVNVYPFSSAELHTAPEKQFDGTQIKSTRSFLTQMCPLKISSKQDSSEQINTCTCFTFYMYIYMQCRKCSAFVDVIFMTYFLCIVDGATEHICAFHRHEAIVFSALYG